MTIIKKIVFVVLVLIIVFSFTFFAAQQAQAALGAPFGGLNVWMIPCTCAAGALMWHFFTPLYNPSTPMAGALVTSPASIIYSHYYLHPGAWAVGTYIPGAGSLCYFGSPPYCYPLPNLGLIIPPTGTSQ